jgi:hypothetical protein
MAGILDEATSDHSHLFPCVHLRQLKQEGGHNIATASVQLIRQTNRIRAVHKQNKYEQPGENGM